MYEAIHLKDGAPSVPTCEYIRRHDLVYHTPALKGWEGIPVGNGSWGGPVYHTQNSLVLPLNHTDAVDFGPDGPLKAWAWEAEEKNTAPFACGQLRVESPLPLFDWVYLEEFEERLNLADALLTGHAKTPFATLDYSLLIAENPGALMLKIRLSQQEAAPLAIKLEKWSTPNFFHHYEQVVRVFDKGLAGTQSRVEENTAFVCHQATGTASALAACATGQAYQAVRTGAHGCQLHFAPAQTHEFTLYLTATVAGDVAAAEKAAGAALHAAQKEDIFPAHKAAWNAFWNRSFVHIGDDYLENLYYMHLYQLNSCGRGKYPPLFGGLWTWFGDSRNWGHFYHWNHQQTLWGIYPAGQPRLAQNYLDYRAAMLQNAEKDAQTYFGVQGAYYSDISNLNGFNAPEPDTLRNLTVGPQIALDFYRHWLYTRDEAFLREKAVPVMRRCMQLYAGLLEKQAGVYRIRGGATAYESYWNLRETLSDYAAIHSLLVAIFTVEDAMGLTPDEASLYRDIAANLYSCPTETVEYDGQKLEIFAAGVKWDGQTVVYGEGDYPLSPFPATLLGPVWPSRLVGLKDRGLPAFEVAQNTARVLFDREVYKLGKLGCSGHAPTPQTAACLGMAQDAQAILKHFAQTYQIFPNGLMHFADLSQNQQWSQFDNPRVLQPNLPATNWEEVHDKTRGQRTRIDSSWFLHCYFEAAANLFSGIQETLLQSEDGVIRLFPAVEEGATCVFRLWATGGFAVSAQITGGDMRLVAIESTLGGPCRVQNPWPGTPVRLRGPKAEQTLADTGGIFAFDTTPGQTLLLYRSDTPPENYYVDYFSTAPNPAPKHCGRVQLGLDRIY